MLKNFSFKNKIYYKKGHKANTEQMLNINSNSKIQIQKILKVKIPIEYISI